MLKFGKATNGKAAALLAKINRLLVLPRDVVTH